MLTNSIYTSSVLLPVFTFTGREQTPEASGFKNIAIKHFMELALG